MDIRKIDVPDIKQVQPLQNMVLLVSFADGTVKELDMKQYDYFQPFKPLFENPQIFEQAKACEYGTGVVWNDKIDISLYEVWEAGTTVS